MTEQTGDALVRRAVAQIQEAIYVIERLKGQVVRLEAENRKLRGVKDFRESIEGELRRVRAEIRREQGATTEGVNYLKLQQLLAKQAVLEERLR